MLYAFIQSSNYSNVYNILQPEALDLESYRKYIEQNHVNHISITCYITTMNISPPKKKTKIKNVLDLKMLISRTLIELLDFFFQVHCEQTKLEK